MKWAPGLTVHLVALTHSKEFKVVKVWQIIPGVRKKLTYHSFYKSFIYSTCLPKAFVKRAEKMDIRKELPESVHNLKPMRKNSLDKVKILTNRWFSTHNIH